MIYFSAFSFNMPPLYVKPDSYNMSPLYVKSDSYNMSPFNVKPDSYKHSLPIYALMAQPRPGDRETVFALTKQKEGK